MSRKHFEALADALAWLRPQRIDAERFAQWVNDVDAIASVCARFNPLFDRARFDAACRER